MTRISLFALATALSVIGGCGTSGPHCEPIPTAPTCTPACDAATEYCSATNTCTAFPVCDPPCDFAMGEFCSATNTCSMIVTCDPICGAGEFCDDGTCRDLPVCSPTCDADEVCVN